MQARVPPVVHLALPGVAVAMYCVIVLPPALAGVDQPTAMRALPGVPVTLSGALGAVGMVKLCVSTVTPRAPRQPSIAMAYDVPRVTEMLIRLHLLAAVSSFWAIVVRSPRAVPV